MSLPGEGQCSKESITCLNIIVFPLLPRNVHPTPHPGRLRLTGLFPNGIPQNLLESLFYATGEGAKCWIPIFVPFVTHRDEGLGLDEQLVVGEF